jgi:hypothetical protein
MLNLEFYFRRFNLSVRILKNHINSISKIDHHQVFTTNFSSTINTLTFFYYFKLAFKFNSK